MWKLHKKSGIEFSHLGKIRGHTHIRVHEGYLIACRLVRSSKYPSGKKTFQIAVHRAIGKLFVKRPYGMTDVNHIDGNRANNRKRNLEWLTRGGNVSHAHRTKLLDVVGESNGRAVLYEKNIKSIRKLDPGKILGVRNFARREVARKVAKKFRVTERSITNVWDRKTWSHVE